MTTNPFLRIFAIPAAHIMSKGWLLFVVLLYFPQSSRAYLIRQPFHLEKSGTTYHNITRNKTIINNQNKQKLLADIWKNPYKSGVRIIMYNPLTQSGIFIDAPYCFLDHSSFWKTALKAYNLDKKIISKTSALLTQKTSEKTQKIINDAYKAFEAHLADVTARMSKLYVMRL